MTSAQMPARPGRHRRAEAPAADPGFAAPPGAPYDGAAAPHAAVPHTAQHVAAPHGAVPHAAAPHVAAQRFAADAVRAAVDGLAFAESQWDVEAWRAAHAAALDLVVLLAAIGPGPEVLLNSAAATLDNARRLVDSGNIHNNGGSSVPAVPTPW
ncbi:hypothetical protein OG216_36590 [Streptomycetaceae bacterium NBC_01309]